MANASVSMRKLTKSNPSLSDSMYMRLAQLKDLNSSNGMFAMLKIEESLLIARRLLDFPAKYANIVT